MLLPRESRGLKRSFLRMVTSLTVSRGRFIHIGGSRFSLSLFGGVNFQEFLLPKVKIGVNFGIDLGFSPLDPKQHHGWGKLDEIRLDLKHQSWSYELASLYPKDYQRIAEKVATSYSQYVKEVRTTKTFPPFEQVLKGFSGETTHAGEPTKIIFSRFGYTFPLLIPGYKEVYPNAKLQFTIHKDNHFLPFKGLENSQGVLSILDRPKMWEYDPDTYESSLPFDAVSVRGTNKITLSENNKLLRLLKGNVLSNNLEKVDHQGVVEKGSNQAIPYRADGEGVLQTFCHKDQQSYNQSPKDFNEIVSILNGFKMESKIVLNQTFDPFQEINKTNQEGYKGVQHLLRADQKAELGCSNDTKPVITEVEEHIIQPTNGVEVFFQAFLGSTFSQALGPLVRQGGQGIVVCVVIGGTFSVLYLVADLYVFSYRQKTAKGVVRTALYLLAVCTRILFPMGIFCSYLFLLGHSQNKNKMPFLTLFEKLPTSDKFSRQAVWFYRGVRVLAHPFRLYLAFLGLGFTKTRILMAGHQFGSFSILMGSTIFFTYFRIKMDQFYRNQNGDARKDAKILAKQVFLLTTGFHALILIKEEVSFVRSIIKRPVKRKSDIGRSQDSDGNQVG